MRRVLAAALLLAPAARAEAPPALQPTHDVDITYKVPVAGGAGMALLQRYRYSAALRRQRVDLPTSGNWMVLDFATHRMQAVRDESHEVVEAPVPPTGTPGYSRLGSETIAGLPCTEWQTRDSNGGQTVTCYTEDGLMLRARRGDQVLIEAVHVSNAAQDATVFEVPAGYTHARSGE